MRFTIRGSITLNAVKSGAVPSRAARASSKSTASGPGRASDNFLRWFTSELAGKLLAGLPRADDLRTGRDGEHRSRVGSTTMSLAPFGGTIGAHVRNLGEMSLT